MKAMLLVSWLLLFSTSAFSDFQDGLDAYNRKDYATALKEWQPLVKAGDAKSQFLLGWMYAEGHGVDQDYKAAFKWYRLAADQGDDDAQYNLGWLYEKGNGVDQNYEAAFKWYRLAAEQEYASAQYNLGALYAYGNGVAQNHKVAFKWYRLAAEQGHGMAQNNLGALYANGNGVAQNYEAASKWLRLAAEQGYAVAQNNLGTLYANGRGVKQDRIHSHMWLDLAIARGSNQAAQNLDDLRKLMTPTEISTAEGLARECVAKNYKGCIPENVTIQGEISAAAQPDSAESAEDVEGSTSPAVGTGYSERVLILQAILKEQGKDPGPVDGLLGQKTITAAKEAIDGFGSIDDVADSLLQGNVEATGELHTCVGVILDSEIYEKIVTGDGLGLKLSFTGPRVALEIDGCDVASRIDIAMTPASVLGLVETEDLGGGAFKEASVIDHGQKNVKIICRRVPNEDRCGVVNLKWVE